MTPLLDVHKKYLIAVNDGLVVLTTHLITFAQTHKSEHLSTAIENLTSASEELSYVIEPEVGS